MALIGEMQYLTIGGNTYSLPVGGGGTVTSVAVSNATNGGLSVSGSPISSSGTITIGHSNVLSSAQTTQAVYPIKIDKNGHISAYGSAVTIPTVPSNIVNTITTTAGTHTAISSSTGAVSFNVPTKTSHLTNDSGFITASHTSTYSLPLAADGTRGGVQIGYSESGTNYAVKLSSEKMYVTVPWTDTKVTTAALKSGTTYYPILATGTGTATRQIDSTLSGLKYVSTAGTTSAVGTAILCLGNTTGSGTANNEQGVLRLYSSNATYYTDLKSSSASSIKTITFPNKTGTIALTSDIPTTHSVPSGGTTGQALVKNSATDYDVSWVDVTTTAAQIIRWTESA